MMLYILLGVLVTSVAGRTPEEVLVDFEPRISQLHERYTGIERDAHAHAYDVYTSMKNIVISEVHKMYDILAQADKGISEDADKIIEDNGMTGQMDLLKTCIDKQLSQTLSMIVGGNGGVRMCEMIGEDQTNAVQELAKPHYAKLLSEHLAIEDVKKTCVDRASDYEAMVCFIDNLFTWQLTHLPDVQLEDREWTTMMYANLPDIGHKMSKCTNFTADATQQDTNNILANFEKCVIAAKPSSDK